MFEDPETKSKYHPSQNFHTTKLTTPERAECQISRNERSTGFLKKKKKRNIKMKTTNGTGSDNIYYNITILDSMKRKTLKDKMY